MAFLPKVDQPLIIDLPGEKLPATVKRVVNKDTAIVELTNQPLAKSHTYKFRELVPVRRTPGMLGETWQAVSAHELKMAEKKAKPVVKKGAKKRAAASR